MATPAEQIKIFDGNQIAMEMDPNQGSCGLPTEKLNAELARQVNAWFKEQAGKIKILHRNTMTTSDNITVIVWYVPIE